MTESEYEQQQDHKHTLEEVAGKIANELINGETVDYGDAPGDFYKMADVQDFLLTKDDLCARFDIIHRQFMLAVNDADKAVPAQMAMDKLTMDAIGLFAQSKAEVVLAYWNQLKESGE